MFLHRNIDAPMQYPCLHRSITMIESALNTADEVRQDFLKQGADLSEYESRDFVAEILHGIWGA